MFDFIHSRKETLVKYLLAGFCVILMVSFGLDYNNPSMQGREAVAKVNETEISMIEFQRSAEQMRANIRAQYGPQAASIANIDQIALDNLINTTLLDGFINQSGLNVSTASIEKQIVELPYFRGGVTREGFANFLRSMGLNSEQLEERLRNELVSKQLQRTFSDLLHPSMTELQLLGAIDSSLKEFRYAKFSPDDFYNKVPAPDDQALEEYFKNTSEKYRTPRSVKFSVIPLDPISFLSKVEVGPNDLKDYYEDHENKYRTPRRYTLKKISFLKENTDSLDSLLSGKPDPEAPKDAKVSRIEKNVYQKTKADEALGKLKEGADFSKVAGEFSEEKATAVQGGSIGTVELKSLPDHIASTLKGLNIGDFSPVLESTKEYVIYLIDNIEEESVKPFDVIKSELETDFRTEEVAVYAHIEAEKLRDEILTASRADGFSLEAFAANGAKQPAWAGVEILPKSTTVALHDGQDLDGFENLGLTDDALKLSAGAVEVIDRDEKFYILYVQDVIDASVPAFADVKAKADIQYRKEKASELAKQKAVEFVDFVTLEQKSGENKEKAFVIAAQKLSQSLVTTKPISRTEVGDPVFADPAVAQAAFRLTSESPFTVKPVSSGDEYLVLELQNIIDPSPEDIARKSTELEKQEPENVGDRVYGSLVANLKATSETWVNPALFNRSDLE